MTLSRALSLSCLLGLASCFADAKEGPTAPRVIDDARGDAWTDGAEHLGELTYGETREGEFRGQPYLAYEFRARAGDTVTIELTAVDDAADPVLFLYAPAREENGEREWIAENDDIAYPDNLSSRIASFELGLAGDYLIVFRDYQGRAGLSYSLELSCEGDSCGGEPSGRRSAGRRRRRGAPGAHQGAARVRGRALPRRGVAPCPRLKRAAVISRFRP